VRLKEVFGIFTMSLFKKPVKPKPIADIEEPLNKDSAFFGVKSKPEEVSVELEPVEDDLVGEELEKKEFKQESEQKVVEHKVVKYGEFKKPKKLFGGAEK